MLHLCCDVIPVIIGRPLQEEGLSVAECKHMLAEHFGLTLKPHVTLLGIGMGSEKTLTIQGKRAVQRADLSHWGQAYGRFHPGAGTAGGV